MYTRRPDTLKDLKLAIREILPREHVIVIEQFVVVLTRCDVTK